jgi:hypothetical protein
VPVHSRRPVLAAEPVSSPRRVPAEKSFTVLIHGNARSMSRCAFLAAALIVLLPAHNEANDTMDVLELETTSDAKALPDSKSLMRSIGSSRSTIS